MAEYALVIAADLDHIFFFDDSDNEEIIAEEKDDHFVQKIVPHFTDQQFKHHFRMSPSSFENILMKVHAVSDLHARAPGHPEEPLEKQLLITVWCLANIECFRSVANRFDISKSSCWSILYRTCKRLLTVNQVYRIICWPSRRRAQEIITGFQRINNFPGCVGVVDGCHIHIRKPKEHPNSYVNRKSYHSVLLQGICDHRKLFLHVYAGEPGSIHDWRLFNKSDIGRRILNNEAEFPADSHIIGDLAYKLSMNLMVGFRDNGNLTNPQRNFNLKLSQIRVCIENAFGLLKCRFRRLKFVETVRLDLIPLLIVSACILHNHCILEGENLDDFIEDLEDNLGGNNNIALRNIEMDDDPINIAAIQKRNQIMNMLNAR